MNRVAIIGGGITGLSAAYFLHKQNIPFVLYEASDRPGGSVRSELEHGFVVEAGADSWISAKPWAAELARELGIADQLVGSADEQRATYIVRNGRLVPMPRGMKLFVPADLEAASASPLFSEQTKEAFQKELQLLPSAMADDESVASFARRHFGDEMVATIVDPLLAGVYGGDSSALSAQAVIPAMVEAERRHGSLIRAFRTNAGVNGESIFTTLRGGMQTLVDALVRRLPSDSLRTSHSVDSVLAKGESWSVIQRRGTADSFSALIITAPAYAAASILRDTDQRISNELEAIPYTNAMTAALAYEAAMLPPIPAGFGFLVPARERREILACTFVHQKWPNRARAGHSLLRVFFTHRLERSDAGVIEMARAELKSLLGIEAEPIHTKVHRWPRAMPQYSVGHVERVKKIEKFTQAAGLQLAGNAYRGVGVSDCVREGRTAAEAVIKQLRLSPSR